MLGISGSSLGMIAGALSFFAYALYIVSVWRRQCRPNRFTWFALTVIGIGLAASYYATGARQTMWIALAYVVGPLIISILSIWYGEGGWSRLDRFCFFGVAVSLLSWWIFSSPLVALVMNIAVDFFALIPTISKSALRPEGEDRVAWSIETVANVINLFALESWTFSLAVYPVYLLVVNGGIAVLLLWPRKKVK